MILSLEKVYFSESLRLYTSCASPEHICLGLRDLRSHRWGQGIKATMASGDADFLGLWIKTSQGVNFWIFWTWCEPQIDSPAVYQLRIAPLFISWGGSKIVKRIFKVHKMVPQFQYSTSLWRFLVSTQHLDTCLFWSCWRIRSCLLPFDVPSATGHCSKVGLELHRLYIIPFLPSPYNKWVIVHQNGQMSSSKALFWGEVQCADFHFHGRHPEQDRMGLVSICVVGNVVIWLVVVSTIAVLGPKPLCLRYARGVLFLIVTW